MRMRKIKKRILNRSPKQWLGIVCDVLGHDLKYFKAQLKLLNREDGGKKSKRESYPRQNFSRVRENGTSAVGSRTNKRSS